LQPALAHRRLIFIDETGAATNMIRRYGRAPRGRRVPGWAPYGHWKTTTFVAGLTIEGFIAPLVVDGPMNRIIFTAYVEQMLVPSLRPGDVVVLDNLSSHKGPQVRDAIRLAGARLLFLPPYTRLTSIPSRWLSQSSRTRCDQPQRETKTISGTTSAPLSTSSILPSAKTTFAMPDMRN
jgi:DDE superfamily endonuclease